jgi:hydrogenase/urease accessory protein HupE
MTSLLRGQVWRVAPITWLAAIVTFQTVAIAEAHEIGTTRVVAVIEPDWRYRIEIVTDAATLLEKLEAPGAQTSSTDTVSLQQRLCDADGVFRRRVSLTFDGVDAQPSIEYGVVQGLQTVPAGPTASIRLTGAIPRGARQLAWTYGWTFATYAFSVQQSAEAKPAIQWLEGGQPSSPMSLVKSTESPRRLQIAWRYLVLGFTHIVPTGPDHMLFVLGIFLLSRRLRAVLWQVSAFTIAHSITLGLSMYGLVSVSPRIVEPLIALSIAYVAVENVFVSHLRPWRVALVFGFGLLHGLGFAGALKELGLPRSEFLTALLTFNVGVEAGQLTVIGAAFGLVGWHYGQRSWYRQRIVLPASALIACVAFYWTVVRVLL